MKTAADPYSLLLSFNADLHGVLDRREQNFKSSGQLHFFIFM